jgi:hypothetical protein
MGIRCFYALSFSLLALFAAGCTGKSEKKQKQLKKVVAPAVRTGNPVLLKDRKRTAIMLIVSTFQVSLKQL